MTTTDHNSNTFSFYFKDGYDTSLSRIQEAIFIGDPKALQIASSIIGYFMRNYCQISIPSKEHSIVWRVEGIGGVSIQNISGPVASVYKMTVVVV